MWWRRGILLIGLLLGHSAPFLGLCSAFFAVGAFLSSAVHFVWMCGGAPRAIAEQWAPAKNKRAEEVAAPSRRGWHNRYENWGSVSSLDTWGEVMKSLHVRTLSRAKLFGRFVSSGPSAWASSFSWSLIRGNWFRLVPSLGHLVSTSTLLLGN